MRVANHLKLLKMVYEERYLIKFWEIGNSIQATQSAPNKMLSFKLVRSSCSGERVECFTKTEKKGKIGTTYIGEKGLNVVLERETR